VTANQVRQAALLVQRTVRTLAHRLKMLLCKKARRLEKEARMKWKKMNLRLS